MCGGLAGEVILCLLPNFTPSMPKETELTLERVLNLDGLDVLFVIDSKNLNDMILDKYRNDPEFRLS